MTEWWRTFHDPELTSLIEVTMRSNFDIQIATSRIMQSRAQRNIAAADLFPDLNASAGYSHAKGSKNVELPLGGSSGGGAAQPAAMTGSATNGPAAGSGSPPLSPFGEGGLPGVTTDLFQTGFDASWEIDVFGGTRRRVEAANANLAAAIEDRNDAAVSLLAEVARNYLVLRGAQHRLSIAQGESRPANQITERDAIGGTEKRPGHAA